MKPTLEDFEARSRGIATREEKARIHDRALYFARQRQTTYQRGIDLALAEALDDYKPLPCCLNSPADRREAAERLHLKLGVTLESAWSRILAGERPDGPRRLCADHSVVKRLLDFERDCEAGKRKRIPEKRIQLPARPVRKTTVRPFVVSPVEAKLRRCPQCQGFCGRPNGRCRGNEPEAA